MSDEPSSDDALLDMLHQAPDFEPDKSGADRRTGNRNAEPAYLCSIKGVQEGPFSVKELQVLIDQGRLASTDRLRAADSLCWIPGRELSDLVFPQGVSKTTPTTATATTSGESVKQNAKLHDDDAATSRGKNPPIAAIAPPVSPIIAIPPELPQIDSPGIGPDNEDDFILAALNSPVPASPSAESPVAAVTREHVEVARDPAKPRATEQAGVAPHPAQTNWQNDSATHNKGSMAAPKTSASAPSRKATEARTRRQRQPISISLSPTAITLFVVMGILAAVLFWPASAKGVFGRIIVDGTPVPVGSLTISPDGGSPISLNVVDGTFQSIDDKPFPDGKYAVALIVGNPLGMPVPQLENTPFHELNGSRFNKSVQLNSAEKNGFEIEFNSAEAVRLDPEAAQ